MSDAAPVRGGPAGPVPLSLALVSSLRPAKVFNEYVQDGCSVTSVDYDDKGETCVTASNDETIQVYNCRSGRHLKTLYSKKYGVDLARFTHRSSAIIYASTKEDGASLLTDTIRYHSLHDNKYLQYYRGHKRRCVLADQCGDARDVAGGRYLSLGCCGRFGAAMGSPEPGGAGQPAHQGASGSRVRSLGCSVCDRAERAECDPAL